MIIEFLDINHAPAAVGSEVYFGFECPKRPTHMCTGLIIRGRGQDVPNRTWVWDNNREQPSFTPSIDCKGCSHGYITAGEWKPA